MQSIRMCAMTFYAWLMKNRWRADPIGDLARDVHGDENWPKRANAWADVKVALPATAVDGARRALLKAWKEYELFVGGPSHLKRDTWVHGVTGATGLDMPKVLPRKRRTKRRVTV